MTFLLSKDFLGFLLIIDSSLCLTFWESNSEIVKPVTNRMSHDPIAEITFAIEFDTQVIISILYLERENYCIIFI